MKSGRGSYGSGKELVQLHMHIHRHTDLAFLVSMEGDSDDAVWIPKSQIDYVESELPGVLVITMPEWLAQKKELI